MKYTIEQLMPKRYPENRPTLGWYWVHNKATDAIGIALWDIYPSEFVWSDIDWFVPIMFANKITNSMTTIAQFCNKTSPIPGAPEEVRPRKYPDEKPEREGLFIAHEIEKDVWEVHRWSKRS